MLFKIETYYEPSTGYSETEDFEYEPSDQEMENAILDIIYDLYFDNMNLDKNLFKANMYRFINDTGLDINFDLEEIFEDRLIDYFYEDAREAFFN